ncbi:hypothetical protein F5Y02DRAFT_366761 [Annulohypoxylon stygium]|nr:hypothetical protein F5Y02DRAFT_366761 [Annulohypoxylon stygium]
MGDVLDILCTTCKPIFTECSSDFFLLHQRYYDLVASKDLSCFICTWIWSKHPRRRRSLRSDV